MTLRSTTSFSVRRTLHLRASSKAHLPSGITHTGTALTSESLTKCLDSGPSEIMFRCGFVNFEEKPLCHRIKRPFIYIRKDFALFSRYNASSRFYHSGSCNKNLSTVLAELTGLRYHLPTPYQSRSKYVAESRLFFSLESSPYASLHASKPNDVIDDVTGTPSPVLMEEEESAFRESIDHLLWQFLSQNPFLSSNNTLKDPISYDLSQCQDLPGVIAIIDSNHDEIDIGRACVAVAKLWSLDTKSEANFFIPRWVPLPSHNLLSRHPALARLMQVIERDFLSLDDAGVVCLLTYLANIGVPMDTPVMQKLFLHTVDRRNNLDLPAVTRIFVFLRSPDLNHHVKGKFIPRIAHFLDKCSTGEELHLINMCFVQTRRLFQDSFHVKHSQKIIDLIDSGALSDPSHTNILINTLRVTSESYNVPHYMKSINTISRFLACRNTPFKTDELARLNVVCRILSLHRGLLFKLHDQAARDIADCQDPLRQAQLFLCLDSKSSRKFSKSIEPVVEQMLNSPVYDSHLLTVYFILLLKTIENVSLINYFWEKMMALTEASLVECSKCMDDAFGKEAALARITKRYLAFNSNLGGQYRHLQVEKRLMSLLLEEMTNGASCMVVGRLARMASFMVAFCGPQGVPPSVIDKLEQNVDQFEIRDLFNLTSGLQKSLGLSKRTAQPVQVEQLVKLSCLLSTASRRIAQSSTNLLDLSALVRASAVYDQVFSKFPNYAVSSGANRGSSGRPFVSSDAGASSNAQPPTNDLVLKSRRDFGGHPSGSLISTSLSNASNNHRLPSPETKLTPSWSNANLISNHLSGDSGSMSSYLNPIFQQRTDFTQRPPGVAGQPLDSQGTVHGPREGWVGHAGVHIVDRSPSTTSSLMQLAPLLIPYTGQMSIKVAMQLSHTFAKTDFANMKLLDSLLQYLAHCSFEVPGRIVAQVLFALFTLGHCSSLPHHNITTLATVITQDVSSLYGTQLLQATLSLCLYQALSRALIASVFNVEFLDLLDDEMAALYSKPRQPQRVRQLLMEVNRGVCIDYPEARVPWFHDQYCSDHIQTANHPRNGFRYEMQSCLSGLLGGEGVFSTNTYSPYFYPLDFTFELDSQGNALGVEPRSPLRPRTAATISPPPPGHTRFCLLLMNHCDYSVLQLPSSTGFQQVYQLKGRQQLMQRHLEVLGYRVISVPRHEWQSMALATPDSKRNYLRRMIWPNESRT